MRTLHTSPMALFRISSRAYVKRQTEEYVTYHGEVAVGEADGEEELLLHGQLVQLARLVFGQRER